MHVATQHLHSSQYSLLPQTQHDAIKSVDMGGKVRCDPKGCPHECTERARPQTIAFFTLCWKG